MDKNYKKALINEMFDNNILNSEEDREKMKQIMNDREELLTGNWQYDYELMVYAWEEALDEEEEGLLGEEETCTDEVDIESIVADLKIGYNFVPGIGAGYCSSEEDLERLRDFVRGGLTVAKVVGLV